jgi:hypothetical protein
MVMSGGNVGKINVNWLESSLREKLEKFIEKFESGEPL